MLTEGRATALRHAQSAHYCLTGPGAGGGDGRGVFGPIAWMVGVGGAAPAADICLSSVGA